jgi:serine/threonine protein kinase
LFVEAALQAHVRGPGVPEVLTAGLPTLDAARPPIGEIQAFEQVHVPGRTLFEVCASEESSRCLDLGVVAGWIFQLCEIVARLQQATDSSGKALHFVHRDITPHNVIVEEASPKSKCRIWLVDFGLSHCLSWGPLSAEHFLQGTPSYLPPEVSNGESPCPASDIYQVALCARHAVERVDRVKKNATSVSWSSEALKAALAPLHLDRPTAHELGQAFARDAKLIS